MSLLVSKIGVQVFKTEHANQFSREPTESFQSEQGDPCEDYCSAWQDDDGDDHEGHENGKGAT